MHVNRRFQRIEPMKNKWLQGLVMQGLLMQGLFMQGLMMHANRRLQ